MSSSIDVFVSHAHQDSERVGLLMEGLKSQGLSVWAAEHEIQAHDRITPAVRKSLAQSKVMLAYYSATYPTRPACRWELTAAFLAAQALGEDPAGRILVVNPERTGDGELRTDHVQPVQLRDALFFVDDAQLDPGRWADEAARVAEIVASHACPLGEASRAMPAQAGERLVDTPGFVGRLDDLWKIHSALSGSEAVQITDAAGGDVAQITGLGGIGKSLLANEYALRFAAAYPGGIAWLRAGVGEAEAAARASQSRNEELHAARRGESLSAERELARHAQMRKIAVDLGISVEGRTPEGIRAEIGLALERGESRLWVVDDLPAGLDLEEVKQWLAPHANAKTLITTQSRGYEIGRRVELRALPVADAYTLLTAKRAPEGPREEAAARLLASDLGGHPLALAVAANRLGAEAGLRSYVEYRAAMAGRAADELKLAEALKPQLSNGHEASIGATLLDSIERLDEPGRDLLRMMSMLAPAPFAKAMLRDVFAQVDESNAGEANDRVVRAIAECDAFSLIEQTVPADGTVSVHALVARTIAFEESGAERLRALRLAAPVALFKHVSARIDAAPGGGLSAAFSSEEWANFMAHARELSHNAYRESETGISDAVIPLLDLAASHDWKEGEYRAAASSWWIALALLEVTGEDQGENALRIKDYLADTLSTLGDGARARELAWDVVQARERSLPAEDAATLSAMHTLAKTLDEPEKSEMFKRVADIRERKLGEHDRETLQARCDVAAQKVYEDPAVAAGELEELLELHEEHLGVGDVDTVKARFNLAAALEAQGEHARAVALFKQVLTERLDTYGEDHEDTLNAMYYVAQLTAKEAPETARTMLEHVVAGREDIYSPEAPKTRNAIAALARVRSRFFPDERQPGEKDGMALRPADLTMVPRGATELPRDMKRTVIDGVTIDHPADLTLDADELRESAARRQVGVQRRTVEKIGRNQPCWCGSGEKYKRCHGGGTSSEGRSVQ